MALTKEQLIYIIVAIFLVIASLSFLQKWLASKIDMNNHMLIFNLVYAGILFAIFFIVKNLLKNA